MRARVNLAVGLPHQINRVTLAVGIAFLVYRPNASGRVTLSSVSSFAFSKCQTNKDGHDTEMKQQNEPDIVSYSTPKELLTLMSFLK